jgi:hypothetical protein
MRTILRHSIPADSKQGLVDAGSFRARPYAHAMAREKLIDVGGSSLQFSTSSATTRRAIAYAFTTASCGVSPYAIAPGISGISAIHRPSVSRSVCTLNRKSGLLVPRGGLRSVSTSIGCLRIVSGARYEGHFFVETGENRAERSIPDFSVQTPTIFRLPLIVCIQGFPNGLTSASYPETETGSCDC